jgi:hypothetical protein
VFAFGRSFLAAIRDYADDEGRSYICALLKEDVAQPEIPDCLASWAKLRRHASVGKVTITVFNEMMIGVGPSIKKRSLSK